MPDTAAEQLERILYILAAAALPEGAAEAELSAALGISPGQAARDVTALADRAFYQPPGSAGGADILVDQGRIQVVPRGGIHRPARLGPGEAAALGLGLRSLALEASGERRARLRALAGRMERFAAVPARSSRALGEDGGLWGAGAAYESVRRAAAERRECRIRYAKPGGEETLRTVRPYVLVHAERWWYLLGPEGEAEPRFYRIDRIAEAEVLPQRFEVPDDFSPEAFLDGGRAFRPAVGAFDVRVRYYPAVSRWVRERWRPEAEEPGGAVVVRHSCADPEWAVQHVLQYGPDAEVVEPAWIRDRVRERVAASLAAWSDPP